MVSNKDNEILKKAIQGNKASLEYLVMTYKNMAYTIAVKIGLSNEDAEEVVQDSFLKAFSSLGNFREASKFSTWLYRIVYNTAITKSKRKKIFATEPAYIIAEKQTGDAENIGWHLLRNMERKRYVNLALEKLTDEDRMVITLYYIAEKDIAEICIITDMKRSAIKMRLFRGRKQLQSELENLLGEEIKDLYE